MYKTHNQKQSLLNTFSSIPKVLLLVVVQRQRSCLKGLKIETKTKINLKATVNQSNKTFIKVDKPQPSTL